MNFLPSRADWRVLTGAALIGSGFGLGLGALYLAGGMAEHAVDYAHARDLAAAAAEGYDGAPAGFGQGVLGFWRAPHGGVATAALTRQARAKELDCLAEAVYFEARGESARGQAAVAQVVMNRVRHPAFPKTVCAVVFQGVKRHGCQFSFACDGSMKASLETDAWGRARRVAAVALAGVVVADIGQATHFHTASVAPSWGLEMRRVTQVGEHVFYRFGAPNRQPVLQKAVLISGPAPAGEIRLMSAVIEKTLETAPPTAPAAEPVSPEPKVAPQPVATAAPSQIATAAS